MRRFAWFTSPGNEDKLKPSPSTPSLPFAAVALLGKKSMDGLGLGTSRTNAMPGRGAESM